MLTVKITAMNTIAHHYRLEPHDLAGHRLRVSLTIVEPDPSGQDVSLPAWIPGSYLIRDFSRHIETLRARRGTRRIALAKRDNHTWHIPAGVGSVTLDYVVYCWDLSVRGAHVDPTHAFFNGTSVFLRVHGQENRPHLLDLVAPKGMPDWKVYTSLPPDQGRGAAREHGFGRYIAPDYDALIDHPVEMGRAQAISFVAHGATHELVFTGASERIDLARIAADVKRICEAQIAFFEPRSKRAPFLDSARKYVFMTQVTPNGYGGLEHRASTPLVATRRDLPARGESGMSDGYRTFLGLVSHEYFHTWHVKRIKPAAFVPYDLTQPNLTRLLWVFEGFTSYYDDLFLLRSGLIAETDYLGLLGKTILGVGQTPGRLKQSVGDSSFDAWTRYYKQDENAGNAIVSYYTKGSLVALCLDLLIRQRSSNTRSLDDVMRLLWTRYGRDFYRGKPRGVEEDAMAEIVQTATGIDLRSELKTFVDGTTDLPIETLLAQAGFELRAQPALLPVSLDARLRAADGAMAVATVREQGAAHRAGLATGDLIVAIDGWKVETQAGLDALLAGRSAGATIAVHSFRLDALMSFEVRLNAAPPAALRLSR